MNQSSIFSRPMFIQLLTQAALSASILFVPLVVMDWGGSGLSVGLVVGGYNAAFMLSNMAAGRAADIYARRWIVRFGLVASIFAFLLQATVVSTGQNLEMFAIARIFGGLAAGIFPNAILAFVYEDSGKVGVFTSRGSLGWGLGMLTAGFIGFFPHIFLFSTLLFAAAFALSMTLHPLGHKGMKIPLFPVAVIKKNMETYGAILIRHTGASMIWVTFPLFMTDLGADKTWIGIIYASNMFVQFALMPFLDRYDPNKLITFGMALTILTILSFTLATSWEHLIPSNMILGAAWATLYVGSLKKVLGKTREKATSTGVLASVI
ncbi:MAG: MFS transporter, partial [Candidatus Thermoplasmatota archaeon]|nr:MFS transporter [Candidatus Thermoplasmatota archaeon]